MYKFFFKRILDVICSLIVLVFFFWLFALVALLVRIKIGAPIIFKQTRVGKGEKLFALYKFRSMSNERDEKGNLLPDKDRLSRFGKILRSTSLDELPEVLNILKGDMSIIGPRPWGPAYLPYYSEVEKHRHDVRPGLSGLAQVNGRTAANWDNRLKYDIEYVNHVSFKLDLKILLLTVRKVFSRADVVDAEVQGNFDDYRRKKLDKEKG